MINTINSAHIDFLFSLAIVGLVMALFNILANIIQKRS